MSLWLFRTLTLSRPLSDSRPWIYSSSSKGDANSCSFKTREQESADDLDAGAHERGSPRHTAARISDGNETGLAFFLAADALEEASATDAAARSANVRVRGLRPGRKCRFRALHSASPPSRATPFFPRASRVSKSSRVTWVKKESICVQAPELVPR